MSLTKQKLIFWQLAKDKLDAAKAKELELRKEICEEILGDNVKGTHKKEFSGMTAKAVGKINMKFDTVILKEIFPDLSKEEKLCIRYKQELVAKHYGLLPEDSIFHKAVITSAGTPSLELKIEKE